MRTIKCILLSIFCIPLLYFWSCKSESSAGEIHGIVTDAETGQPLSGVSVIIPDSDSDTITTSGDGAYLIKNLQPGVYEIHAFKSGYMKKTDNATVVAEKTAEVNFALTGAIIVSDTYLDFEVESTTRNFTVSKAGKSVVKFTVSADQGWIEISPSSGELTNNNMTIKVTVKRPDSSYGMLKGEILITSGTVPETQEDKIKILVNGALDRDLTYYKVVKIGSQYWMGENTHAGITVSGGTEQNDPLAIKKYSYDTEYGGLYTFSGMMRGAVADNKSEGNTNGICPVGWHIPTLSEWNELINYLGEPVSGIKLKEAGSTHWLNGNVATNESGFTALPGGMWDGTIFQLLKSHALFWTASSDQAGHYYAIQFEHNAEKGRYMLYSQSKEAVSVRCIRNR